MPFTSTCSVSDARRFSFRWAFYHLSFRSFAPSICPRPCRSGYRVWPLFTFGVQWGIRYFEWILTYDLYSLSVYVGHPVWSGEAIGPWITRVFPSSEMEWLIAIVCWCWVWGPVWVFALPGAFSDFTARNSSTCCSCRYGGSHCSNESEHSQDSCNSFDFRLGDSWVNWDRLNSPSLECQISFIIKLSIIVEWPMLLFEVVTRGEYLGVSLI